VDATNSPSRSAGVLQPRVSLGRPLSIGSGPELVVGDPREADPLREVLAQEPVGVLVRAPLPGRVRIAEIDIDAGVDLEAHVLSHLVALVPGQATAQRRRKRLDGFGHRLAHMFGAASLAQREQHHEPRAALDEGADRALVVLAHQQIALPVTRDGAVCRLGRTLADHDHLRDAATLFEPSLRDPFGTSAAQASGELPAQLTASLHVDGLVDRLVRDLHAPIVAELVLETPADRLRRPQPFEVGDDTRAQSRVGRQLRRLRSTRPLGRSAVGIHGSISVAAAVGVDLAAHRRRGAIDEPADRPQRHPFLEAEPDLDPVLER
jgi:hypothetical protein